MFRKKIALALTIFLLSPVMVTSVFAQYANPTKIPSPKSVDYQLSYPGLLPDHPLYFLKTARDRIMSFFISKPLEKAEFNLLQADKRVQASYTLFKKGEREIDLSQSTFSKSANYFEESLNNTYDAKSQGMETSEFTKKLENSNKKHQQILMDITTAQNGKYKKKFATEHERLEQFEKRVKGLNAK